MNESIEQMTSDVAEWLGVHIGWYCKKCGQRNLTPKIDFKTFEGQSQHLECGGEVLIKNTPEYVSPAGRVLLLKEMMTREDWEDLKFELATRYKSNINSLNSAINNVCSLITDDTGLLLRAVWEWKRRAA